MPDATPDVLIDVRDYLDALVRERTSPQAASARLQPLRARHPGTDIDLVWEVQSFDGSVHYDALIRPGTNRTLSLSVSPNDSLPWPLRGLQRWTDSDLVRVNGHVLSVADAIAQLDLLWQRTPLMQQLIDHCLVQQALAREPVDVTDDEVQDAFDGMRRGRGLFGVDDLEAWMKDTGVSWDTLEAMATQLARVARLRERTVGDRVDALLVQDLPAFDVIVLATVHTRSEQQALAVRDMASSGGHALLQAAQNVYARSSAMPLQTTLRRMRRHQLDAVVQHAIGIASEAPPAHGVGGVVGPLAAGDGYMLAEVLTVEAAGPNDPQLRRLATIKLHDDWLREQRRTARIEWFWGNVERTGDGTGWAN
jgi:putative peptide maturation system protein